MYEVVNPHVENFIQSYRYLGNNGDGDYCFLVIHCIYAFEKVDGSYYSGAIHTTIHTTM